MAPLQRAAVGTAWSAARPGSDLGDVDAQGVPMPSRYRCPRVDNPVPTGAWGKGPTCHLQPQDRYISINSLFELLLLHAVTGARKCHFHHH